MTSLLSKTCANCSASGRKLVMHADGGLMRKYCEDCFQSMFGHSCVKCSKTIIVGGKSNEQEVSLRGKHWHQSCFRCSKCNAAMTDTKQTRFEKGQTVCGLCASVGFSDTCAGCSKRIASDEPREEYQARYWHQGCYKCGRCGGSLDGTWANITDEGAVCQSCDGNTAKHTCEECGKVIQTTVLAWKQGYWHRECFCCAKCKRSVAQRKFFSRDDKPYCDDCYTQLFSGQCAKCKGPLQGDLAFIRTGEDCWHKDCFICCRCSALLRHHDYLLKSGSLYCAECVKKEAL